MARIARSEFSYIGRSMQPSGISLTVCIVLGALLTTINFIAIQQKLAVGDKKMTYDYLLQPWHTVSNSYLFNTILTALMWGVVGLILYLSVLFVMSLRAVKKNHQNLVTFTSEGIAKQQVHEYDQVFRIGVLLIGMIMIFALLPLIRYLVRATAHALAGADLAIYFLLHMVGWVIIFHLLVVMIRLISKRTRVFGEILV